MSIFKHKKKNILVLGSNGMLGYDVYQHFLKLSQLKDSDIGVVVGLDASDGYDFSKRYVLGNYFMTSIHFDWCINCIAYTDTKAAESYDEGYFKSYELNALCPKYIAESCAHLKTGLIHVSTDYVFSELSSSIDASTKMFDVGFDSYNSELYPKNIYGLHKLLGEQFIKEEFSYFNYSKCSILRTSWLYGMHNNKSFIHKFMNNVVKTMKTGSVSVDMTSNEISIPTSCEFLIACIDEVMSSKAYLNSICHAVPFSEKNISRLDFAQSILDYYKCAKNSMPEDMYKINNLNLADVVLMPKISTGHQPTYSKMFSSFVSISGNWRTWFIKFMSQNAKDILQNALNT